jgi:hypothetical protein
MPRSLLIAIPVTAALVVFFYWSRQSPTAASPTAASPTAASPTAPSPTAPSPTAPSPTAPSPTVASPTVAGPTAPSPTSPSPTEPSPTALGKDLYVPRQATHLIAIEGIRRTFRDPVKAEAYIKLVDETCALEQQHALEDASIRSEYYESIAAQKPPNAALELANVTDDYLARLMAAIDKEMALIPEGAERQPFQTKEFKKLLVDQCPSVVAGQ